MSRAGLQPHYFSQMKSDCYTLRPEKRYLSLKPDGNPQTAKEEVVQLIEIGVNGLFCDDPGTCRQIMDA